MNEHPETASGERSICTVLSGPQLLSDPLLNKGTAFTESERDVFDLHGLLPPNIGTLQEQVARRLQVLRRYETNLERYAFLRELQDANETLFYAVLVANLKELLPIVYTPTVGAGCEHFSHLYRKPRGLFLSPAHMDRMDAIFSNERYNDVAVIVVTDGERILGLGDQGAGGMGIPIGKLALYSGCGGIHPATTLPIMLDVGTDNEERLNDPLYIGWRHKRIRGAEYDAFVDHFVSAVKTRWPDVLLQWEDFAKSNATRLLARYQNDLCTFNDDIQGTAAVATGTLLSAISVTGTPLAAQRVVMVGAGSAGCGIASLIRAAMIEAGVPEDTASNHFYMVDRKGLLMEDSADLAAFQMPFVKSAVSVASWTLDKPDHIELIDVIRNVRPTVLIGVSGQPGAFTEASIRLMATLQDRPVLFPLSNPTSRAEATVSDLIAWTDGRAVIGTGSPFPPVMRNGHEFQVDQTNNSYIFPGLGLGALAVKARRISEGMLMAAARALAEMSPARSDAEANLLPPVDSLRDVAVHIACAVALQACKEALCDDIPPEQIYGLVKSNMWCPRYLPYVRREIA